VLNDFNTHRSKIKNKVPNLTDEEAYLSKDKNSELNVINKTEQINLSEKYKKELNDYNIALIQDDNEINNKINPNNNINYYKKEINTIRQQIILLKSKISENELIINDYKNTINVLKSNHSEEINNLNNHINILNDYILVIYQFFNGISKKYIPSLNFKFDSNQNEFKLIDMNDFQNKLRAIDDYIFNLNKVKFNYGLNNNIKENIKIINSNEEKIRMEKEDTKLIAIKNFNNDFIIQKLKEDSINNTQNDDYSLENNNSHLIDIYKNLENKFDILEKAIEEGKKSRYDFIEEENKEMELNDNNDIILTNFNNKIEKDKNNFLEELYRNEKLIQNKHDEKKDKKGSRKKRKSLTKISQNNNLKNKKGYRNNVLTEENKMKKNIKNNLKNKK